MAQGRIDLGGLTAAAIVLALAVAGCGGGDSSASGTAGAGTSASVRQAKPTKESAGTKEASGTSREGAGPSKTDASTARPGVVEGKRSASVDQKKHPPLELPTGKPEEGPSPAQRAKVPTADLEVSVTGGMLTAANTCRGKDESPAVEWGEVPAGTAELALFMMNLQPVEGKLYFDWAVAGIDPSSEGLEAGGLPQGAVVGQNSAGQNGYSLCPSGSGTENYIFALYAIPKGLLPKQGFEPLALRKEATKLSQSVGLFSAQY
jgi:phosphatidylethanolamine-binding protein (PEBP) family uncharacterized protein